MSEQPVSKPVILKCEPAEVDVVPGRVYSWCQCGFSAAQPFCDNAHREKSTLKSIKVEFDRPQTVLFCQCKQTSTPPFCDGTHKTLQQG